MANCVCLEWTRALDVCCVWLRHCVNHTSRARRRFIGGYGRHVCVPRQRTWQNIVRFGQHIVRFARTANRAHETRSRHARMRWCRDVCAVCADDVCGVCGNVRCARTFCEITCADFALSRRFAYVQRVCLCPFRIHLYVAPSFVCICSTRDLCARAIDDTAIIYLLRGLLVEMCALCSAIGLISCQHSKA